ncbi:hypothetical protein, partial [Clavibacter michiganensis]|uniref:hypothetical protein n=1 Tax=Clavibacter michiganensis TaxID=28447 RepID=UPI00293104D8
MGVTPAETLGPSPADITTATLRGVMLAIRREDGPWPEFTVDSMARYGAAELGFGSDAGGLSVFRPLACLDPHLSRRRAQPIGRVLPVLTAASYAHSA